MTCQIESRVRHPDLSVRKLSFFLRRLMKELQIETKEVSLLLTNDEEIQTLNASYRKKNKPTDVLAFAMSESAYGDVSNQMLGDVVISLDTAFVQATERRVSLEAEVQMLLVHGILHLLGWDHDTKPKEKRMFSETERLLVCCR